MLGEVLGDVIRESGGQDLLDDVERLRRSVIAARQPSAGAGAAEEIAAMVAGWPLERAEAVAHAFTLYFHLTNLAEEQQRIRTLRERDTADGPPRESLAATVAGLRERLGGGADRRSPRESPGAPGAHRAPDRGAAAGCDRGAAPDPGAARRAR